MGGYRADDLIDRRYRLEHELGQGGMGTVWAAKDEKLLRTVAVKLMTERMAGSKKALGRFEREAMAVARLRSPYIVAVHDYGIDRGVNPYIVMEVLAGQDLTTLLKRKTKLSIEATAKVVVQTAKALHVAHEAGIIHRDLKPGNIFLVREHGEEIIKVFDFGVAKALNDLADSTDTTAEGMLLGTPRYMSPEQAHGAKRVDHRSDLWSLGVIAYLCVTGRTPFIGRGVGNIITKICTEDPLPATVLNMDLPPEIDRFFDRALAKNIDERFQSARELGHAFAELTDISLSAFDGVISDPDTNDNVDGPTAFELVAANIVVDSSPGQPPPDETASTVVVASSPKGGPAVDNDGTLGPAARTLNDASGRRRFGLIAAIVAVGAVGLVAIGMTLGDKTGGQAERTAPASTVAPEHDAPPPASATATSTASAAATPPSAAPEADEPVAKRRVVPKAAAPAPTPVASAAPTATPTAAPTATPTATKAAPANKGSDDGLDLFKKRW